jgi:hypothetical protein
VFLVAGTCRLELLEINRLGLRKNFSKTGLGLACRDFEILTGRSPLKDPELVKLCFQVRRLATALYFRTKVVLAVPSKFWNELVLVRLF